MLVMEKTYDIGKDQRKAHKLFLGSLRGYLGKLVTVQSLVTQPGTLLPLAVFW